MKGQRPFPPFRLLAALLPLVLGALLLGGLPVLGGLPGASQGQNPRDGNLPEGNLPDGNLHQGDLPIFDAHLHYSRDAWDAYPPETALALLDQAGVYRALVSSTPDDGTVQLHEQAPERIVPILRPYRTGADMATWTRDPTVLAYVEDRLSQRPYRGIGEFHLSPGQASALVPRAFAALAAEQDLFLHAHADAVAVEELLQIAPGVKVLWAHAGMSATPAAVGRLLDLYPSLWVELALRTDVAPGGVLDPAWGNLFRRHPDRFMVGSDTWVPSRWGRLPETMAEVQVWLRQLPPAVAEQIAYGNAERLFATPEPSLPSFPNN